MTKESQKLILDVTCGARSIWFNKNHPAALYGDIRKEPKGFIEERSNYEVNPDILLDFRDLPFEDQSFKLVIWDPPHLKGISPKSWIGKKYGSLKEDQWEHDIRKGFEECFRVLDDFGILIMKWSCCKEKRKSRDIPLKEMLKILPVEPIVGHTTGSKSNTNWLSFMKIPSQTLLSQPLDKQEGI